MAFDYVSDGSPEFFSLTVLSDRVFAIRRNTATVDWDMVEVTDWPANQEDNPILAVRHDYSTAQIACRDLMIFQGTRLIALMYDWANNEVEVWEFDLSDNSWDTLVEIDTTDAGLATTISEQCVIGKDDDYIYVGVHNANETFARVFYSGDNYANEFGAGWDNGYDGTWCAGSTQANRRKIRAIWADSGGTIHFYGQCVDLVASLYVADYDRFYSTSAAGVAFSTGDIAGGNRQLDCVPPYDPVTPAAYQMIFTIHRPSQEDTVFAIRDSDDALVYSTDEGGSWATVDGTFDGSGSYSGADIYTEGIALQAITWQDTIARWFAFFSAEIVNSLDVAPEDFTTLHIVTYNFGSVQNPVFWWDRGTDMRVYYQTQQSASSDIRIYQWDTDENLAPSTDFGPALMSRPADIDAGGLYLYIAALSGGNPVLLKLDADLSSNATSVFAPGAGSDIGVECGRQDSDVVWIGGGFDGTNTVEVSDDAGGSFSVADDGSFNAVTAFEVGPGADDARVLVVDNAADAYETFDSGGSWFARGTGLITDDIRSMRRLPANPEEVLVGGQAAATDIVNYSPNALVSVSDISGVLPQFDVKAIIFE